MVGWFLRLIVEVGIGLVVEVVGMIVRRVLWGLMMMVALQRLNYTT